MEHAKILAVATCVTVPPASTETTVKTVGSLKCSFRKRNICIRVFPRFCEAYFRVLFWRRLRSYVYYITGLNPLCFEYFRSFSQTLEFSPKISTNVSCCNHVGTMEPAPTISTVTIVTVLQVSTEPTVQSVSRYRFEFHG